MKKLFSASLLLFVCSVMLLVGCSRKVTPPTSSKVTSDSIITDRYVIERDTTLKTPSALVGLKIPLTTIKEGFKPVENSKKQSKVSAKVENGNLVVDCKCDSLEIAAKIRDTYESALRKTTTVETITQEVRYVPWYIKLLAWIGAFALTGLVVLLARKFL